MAVLTLAPHRAAAEDGVFRWAASSGPFSLDPQAYAETLTASIMENIYEGLVTYDVNLRPVPALAESWTQPSPTTWIFKLRPGVHFQDGRPLVADDVVFSIKRAGAPASDFKFMVNSIKEARKIDDLTVEIETKSPNPTLLNGLEAVYIMSKSWAEENNSLEPTRVESDKQVYAALHTNGTGPFVLKEFQPGIRVVLEPNPDWWNKDVKHNIKRAIFTPITNESTRVAALLSKQVDLIQDLPPQSMSRVKGSDGFNVLSIPELRPMVLGMDVYSDELIGSNIKGKNPLKDKRVRQAFYQAIDVEPIVKVILEGAGRPTGLVIAPAMLGYSKELDTRLPYDPEAARKLLAEAGYPDGFSLSMDCPNDRYVKDVQVCQAVVAQLAKIGVKVDLLTMPKVQWFPKLQRLEVGFYIMGYGTATGDSGESLFLYMQTKDEETKGGRWNIGRYQNPATDTIIALNQEMDPDKRVKMIQEVLTTIKNDIAVVPLYDQMVNWGASDRVEAVVTPINMLRLKWTRIN